ncbi:MAG: hypothetical protein K2Q18_11255, partial [Bdellovibrionales bacterium]|nr:hypothetical protein [Bdellovibrionales bacterium]
RLIALVQYSSGKCDGVAPKKEISTSDAELGKKCLEVGKLKIDEQAKAFGCSVDLSKVEVQEVDNRWYNPSKYVWYQAMNNCNNSDRVVTLVQYSQGKCITNGSIANVSLKNAVETVIKNTATITSSQQEDVLKISDKPKNIDLKAQPSVDTSPADSSKGASK